MTTQSNHPTNQPNPARPNTGQGGTPQKAPGANPSEQRHPNTVTPQDPKRGDSTQTNSKPDAQPRSDAPKTPDLDKNDPRRLEVEAGKSSDTQRSGGDAKRS